MRNPEVDEVNEDDAAIVDALVATAVCCWRCWCCLGCGRGAGDDSCAEKSSADVEADGDGDCAAENETSI